jgi:hypothetical protein
VFTIVPLEKCIIGVLHENSHLHLGSFVINILVCQSDNNSWEKQAKNEVETLVRRVSPHLQKLRRQHNKIHRKF